MNPMRHRRRYLRLIWLLGAVVLLGATVLVSGAVTAGAEAEALDPEQGVFLPVSKVQGIQDIEGEPAEPSPPVDPEPDDPADSIPPDAVAANISPNADGESNPVAPLPGGILADPTNTYRSGTSAALTIVHGGADPADPTRGLLVHIEETYDTGGGNTYRTVASGRGAIEIVRFEGAVLWVCDMGGRVGYYNLGTHALTWDTTPDLFCR